MNGHVFLQLLKNNYMNSFVQISVNFVVRSKRLVEKSDKVYGARKQKIQLYKIIMKPVWT